MINKRSGLVKRYVDSDYVYPYTSGCDGEYSTGWEHYIAEEDGEGIMQLHSPIIAGCESLFVKQLAGIVNEYGYEKVVLVDCVENVPAEVAERSEEEPFVRLLREAIPNVKIDHEREPVSEMAVRLEKT